MKRSSLDEIEATHSHIDNHVEKVAIDSDNQPNYKSPETIRILRKVDYRLIPMLTILYVMGFLDRGNIGNAKVAGMNTDLNLTSSQYNIALTVFFFPYSLFEVPSNMVLKILRPSIWICIMMTSWGVVMTLQGLVKNYHGLVITRCFLGLAEAGFFPAANYLLTTWYCRFEIQTRIALFYSAASLAGAFSGLLAFAIEKMHGVGNLEGWRWIYILEGILTVLIAITLPWTLPDSPETASFLEREEKDIIHARLQQDAGTSAGTVHTNEGFQWKYITAALTEWRLWFAVIAYWGNSVCLYAFTYSAPSIILDLGYSAANAQLLTIPIYIVAVLSTLFFARLADKKHYRYPCIVIPFCIGLCGFIALLCIPHPRLPGLTYAFLFFIPTGVYPTVVGVIAWVANNLAPSWKRAVGMALLISIGNLGGAIGSNIFIDKEKPRYWLGYGFCFGICLAAIGCVTVLRRSWLSENKKRDAFNEADILAQYTTDELLELGDKSPLFRYVV